MRRYFITVCLACLLPFAVAGCATTTSRQTLWEYKILEVVQDTDASDAEKQLNELARQGWALASESTTAEGRYVHTFVLKRPLQQ